MLCALRNSRPPIRSKCSTPNSTYSSQHWGTPCSAGLHWRGEEQCWTFPTGSRCGPLTHRILSLCRAGPQEGRSGSHHYRTHTGEWFPTPASACPRAAELGGSRSGPTCLPVPEDLSSWAPCVGRAMEQGADWSQTRRAESSPSFSWSHGNRDSPLILVTQPGPRAKATA